MPGSAVADERTHLQAGLGHILTTRTGPKSGSPPENLDRNRVAVGGMPPRAQKRSSEVADLPSYNYPAGVLIRIDGALYLTLRSTNPIENLNGAVAHHTRNVKRWRDGQMVLRWVGAALVQASGGFRRVRGMRDLPKLCATLDRHYDARSVNSERKVA